MFQTIKEKVADFGLIDPIAMKNAEAHQYLYLPVRLFIVLNQTTPDPIQHKEVESGLREAVGQADWHEKGIASSADYLLHIFEDGREMLRETLMQDEDTNLERVQRLRCTVGKVHVRIGSAIATLPCSHWFHETCIVAWLEQANICPSCDKKVYSEDLSAPDLAAEMSST